MLKHFKKTSVQYILVCILGIHLYKVVSQSITKIDLNFKKYRIINIHNTLYVYKIINNNICLEYLNLTLNYLRYAYCTFENPAKFNLKVRHWITLVSIHRNIQEHSPP